MARVTGPALSVEALGPLGGALTYSRTQGGRVAKLTPRRAPLTTGPLRAARATLSFAQRSWGADINNPFMRQFWEPLARQQNLPAYNTFIGAAINATREGRSPSIAPTPFGAATPSAWTIGGVTTAGNTMTVEVDIVAYNDGYGVWIALGTTPAFTGSPTNIAASINMLEETDLVYFTQPIRNLKRGIPYYVQGAGFDFDGHLDVWQQMTGPIILP